MKDLAILVLAALGLPPLPAQQMLRDFAPGPSPQATMQAGELVVFQGRGLFRGTNSTGGTSLWSTDGTPAGTVVGDTLAGDGAGFAASSFVLFAVRGVFAGADRIGIWRTDGTLGSTTLLVAVDEIASGPVRGWAELNGIVLCNVGQALWRTDGTPGGTVKIASNVLGDPIRTGQPTLVRAGGLVFYVGTSSHGFELWRSDGTSAGTQEVSDLAPSGSSGPSALAAANGKLWFNADDGVHGREPWVSDGTVAGTQMLFDLPSGASFPSLFTEWNGACWFSAYDAAHGYELWRSDGTPAGTGMVLEITPGSAPTAIERMAGAGGSLLLTTTLSGGGGARLLATDGTPAGTRVLAQLAPPTAAAFVSQEMVAVGSRVFFKATTAQQGQELWTSDGTPAGTALVLREPTGSAASTRVVPFGAKLLFYAAMFDARLGRTVTQPWITDATSAGTFPLWAQSFVPAGASSQTSEPVEYRGRAWFTAPDAQGKPVLWSSDGTGAGTRIEIDAASAAWAGVPVGLAVVAERLQFVVAEGTAFPVSGLWRSDGTAQGTTKIGGWSYGLFGGYLSGVRAARLFFVDAFDQPSKALMRTDGTPAGTFALATVPSNGWGSVLEVGTLDDVQYVIGIGYGSGPLVSELWRSDGTTASLLLKLPGGVVAARIWRGRIWLLVDDNLQKQLWQSDGTAAGTVPIVEPPLPSTATAGLLAVTDDALVFAFQTAATTATFWKTTTGQKNAHVVLQQVALPASALSSSRGTVVELPSRIVLALEDTTAGTELWAIEPSTSSVGKVRDVYPGLASGLKSLAAPKNGARATRVPFAAGAAATGAELWVTDGTAAGTRFVADLNPGPGASAPAGFTRLGERIWFVADDGVHGREPFVMPAGLVGAGGFDDLGGGCSLAAGPVPILSAEGVPALGALCELLLRDVPPSQPSVFVLSLVRAELPLWTGCVLRVGVPEIDWIVFTSAAGTIRQPLPIPSLPQLLGAAVHVQTGTATPAFLPALSNALRIVVGSP